ncbi:bile acid:sodium symporter family protein [Corynebacterium dentalis]|uniref:bile acid:sodium symporter family protein n=1 Tax=Corynebacterium dentalis TaxID=2014528 RepID=UPI00289F3F8B|nr:bile acid:sodium symporter family protein [Corynebacterium dentalis]
MTSSGSTQPSILSSLGFPILVIIGGVIGYVTGDGAASLSSWVTPLLGLIMFGMGLTIKPGDFVVVAKRPLPVLIGVVAQFVIMPLVAVLVVWMLSLPPEIAVGVILVGCCPGGTSSNVVSYLANGDVALSVAMTTVSTLLAPLLTPALMLMLAGQYMDVSVQAMALSILQVVLLPVVAGLVIARFAPRVVELVGPVLPWVSALAISTIVAIVVGGSKSNVATAGALVFGAVILHNAIGYLLGYLTGVATRQPIPARRTMAVEVGMQNSGLAASLASSYINPLAALPGAVFSVWHNISGAILAATVRYSDMRK